MSLSENSVVIPGREPFPHRQYPEPSNLRETIHPAACEAHPDVSHGSASRVDTETQPEWAAAKSAGTGSARPAGGTGQYCAARQVGQTSDWRVAGTQRPGIFRPSSAADRSGLSRHQPDT